MSWLVEKLTRLPAKIWRAIRRPYRVYVLRDPFMLEVRRWFRDRGDTALRLDYPLDETSIVFDLGGYVGDFAAAIHDKFGCRVFVFEPDPRYFEKCARRFEHNLKVEVFNFGIADVDGEFILSDRADGSSFLQERQTEGGIVCELRRFSSVVDELNVHKIDLMKINIEGGEFPLMEHILDHDHAQRVTDFQIQFHDFAENAVERRERIAGRLAKTHERTWCYEFVWENWKTQAR